MANLVVSNTCNLHCSFCFARDYLHDQSGAAPFLSPEAYDKRLDFLARSGMDEVRLIGGEPTLHPGFARLLGRALERFAKVVVFSNGLAGEAVLAALEAVSPEALTVMINTSASGPTGVLSEQEQARRAAVMRRLGRRAMAGYTIASPDFDCDFLLALIHETGCRTSLRLGLAQPAPGGKNAWLSPRDYPAAGERIAAFALRAAGQGVRVELDCGFVRCMFSQASFDALMRANTRFVSNCSPVLDVDLDGQASHCFPLAGKFTAPLSASVRAQDLRERLGQAVRPYRLAGIYPECSSCALRLAQECSGGCLALTIQRFHPANFRLRLPERALDEPLES